MRPHRTPLTAVLLASLFGAAALVACSGGHREGPPGPPAEPGAPPTAAPGEPTRGASLSLKGSDTMVILAQRFADGYMRSHEGSVLEVSGGGSGTGFAALLNGTTDIANASRPINARETAALRERGTEAVETRVALDALAVYVSESNTIPSLTMAQLSGIFRGEITNWSAVGGSDAPIILYSRENNSGTYAYFKEHVLDGADFAATAQTLPGTAAVINAVSHDPNGIGYGGIGYAEGVRTVPLAAEGAAPVAPTMENAVNGSYPISRFLLMYTAGPPTGTAADFLAWVLTPEAQALVTEAGFFPLPGAAAGGAGGPGSEAAPSPGASPEGTAPAPSAPAELEAGS
jgi:phosphate transport system substrate-binding protein